MSGWYLAPTDTMTVTATYETTTGDTESITRDDFHKQDGWVILHDVGANKRPTVHIPRESTIAVEKDVESNA